MYYISLTGDVSSFTPPVVSKGHITCHTDTTAPVCVCVLLEEELNSLFLFHPLIFSHFFPLHPPASIAVFVFILPASPRFTAYPFSPSQGFQHQLKSVAVPCLFFPPCLYDSDARRKAENNRSDPPLSSCITMDTVRVKLV